MTEKSTEEAVPSAHIEKNTKTQSLHKDSSEEADFKDSTEDFRPSEKPPSEDQKKDNKDEKILADTDEAPEIKGHNGNSEGSVTNMQGNTNAKLTKKQRKKQAKKQKNAENTPPSEDRDLEAPGSTQEPGVVPTCKGEDHVTKPLGENENENEKTETPHVPHVPPRTSVPADVVAAAARQTGSGDGAGSSEGNIPGMTPGISAGTLLEARQAALTLTFGAKDAGAQHAIRTGVASVQNTYRDIRATTSHLPSELVGPTPVDWPLWDRVMGDYQSMVVHEPKTLAAAVAAGIPSAVRGIVWQMVARSKSLPLEEMYMHLKSEPCVHEKAIRRDLTRTSFFARVDAAHKAEELYSVIHAYAGLDPDVGYTQGMAFIAVPLVMNMAESECFCLLVTLMKEYGLRELFCPEMPGLHRLLHQYDRLLAQQRPLLYNHLCRHGVRASMYASQWFLTFFSYKFPLSVVLRIFDMVVTQGVEAVLRLALSLVAKNESRLLALGFDGLVAYLKDSLFDVYAGDHVTNRTDVPSRRFSLRARPSRDPSDLGADSSSYRLDAFIQDAMEVDISPLDLAKWSAEFDAIAAADARQKDAIEQLRAETGALRHEIKALEMQMYTLNHDHVGAVQGLVDVKVALPEVLGDVGELRRAVARLEGDISGMEARLGADHDSIPADIEAQIQGLLEQNATETERFAALEEELEALHVQDDALTAELRKNKKWFWK